MAVKQRLVEAYMEWGARREKSIHVHTFGGGKTSATRDAILRILAADQNIEPTAVPSELRTKSHTPSVRSPEEMSRFTLSLVEAAPKFRPENISTVSITLAEDSTIEHRMDVQGRHTKLMSRALRALANKLDEED